MTRKVKAIRSNPDGTLVDVVLDLDAPECGPIDDVVLTPAGDIEGIRGKPNLELEVYLDQRRIVDACVGVQSTVLEAGDQKAYDARMGVLSKHYLTQVAPADGQWILDRLRDRIAGKVVVELGAGIGMLAIALAGHAKHVFAIEADPMWSFVFCRYLYRTKPANLTYILDRAENLVDVIKGDVAIVVTGSDEDNLRQLAGRFAPDVCLPWQDWNGGKAVAKTWGHW